MFMAVRCSICSEHSRWARSSGAGVLLRCGLRHDCGRGCDSKEGVEVVEMRIVADESALFVKALNRLWEWPDACLVACVDGKPLWRRGAPLS